MHTLECLFSHLYLKTNMEKQHLKIHVLICFEMSLNGYFRSGGDLHVCRSTNINKSQFPAVRPFDRWYDHHESTAAKRK